MQRGVNMFDVFIKSILTFLVIFAVVELFSKVLDFIFSEPKEKKDVFVFIHVLNQEDTIEYVIRSTIMNYLNSYGGRIVPYIVIVDKGSEDKTVEISKKLCEDYDFVYCTTEEKYLQFKNQIK